jgi:hypothetical protein
MNYKSKIYDILNEERDDMIRALPQPTMLHRSPAGDVPTLHGGIRVMDKPIPGYYTPEEPATLATGSNVGSMMPSDKKLAMRRYEQEEGLDGGKINFKKLGKSASKGLKSIGKVAGPVLKEVGKEVLPIVKKEGIKALKNYLMPAAETVAANPELLLAAAGRPKKARKNYKVIREMSESDEEGGSHLCGAGARKPNARAAIVKRVMNEKGLSMIAASKYVKEHNLYKK